MNFEQTLILAGLMPRDIVADGRWRRCQTEDHPRKRNGAYLLVEDGSVGFWRNWAVDSEVNVWRPDGEARAAPVDMAAIRAKREKERAERRKAIDFARDLLRRAGPYRQHRYLADKGLSPLGCEGLRVWTGSVWVDEVQVFDDWLLVPMFWNGRITNVQRISTTGVKRQIAKAPQVGCTFTMDRPRAALTVFVEGLATGLAVFQAVRNARVIVTFYADNILPVVQAMRPAGSVVIAADNDWRTAQRLGINPGISKAQAAADAIGCGVAYPARIEGSDFADALKEWGAGAARRIEREIVARARYVMT